MPDIYEVAELNRAALLKRDEAALRALVSYYQAARKTAEEELATFNLKIASAKANGQEVGRSWAFQERRLTGLLERIGKELDGWAGDALGVFRGAHAGAVRSGRSESAQLLDTALVPAKKAAGIGVTIGFDRLPDSAFVDMAGFLSDGSPLVESFLARLKTAKVGALMEIKNALTTGVALGKDPIKTARRVRAAMGGPLFVSMRYVRTETLRAYRTSTLREYRANADLVGQWEWSASLSRRTCPVCLAMHGQRFPLSEPFASHPNCRCAAIPVVKPLSEIVPGAKDAPEDPVTSGEEYLRGLPERDQVAILGKEKAQRWRDGSLPLRNLVGFHKDQRWGPGRSERSLKDAMTGEAPGAFPGPGNSTIPKPAPVPSPPPPAPVVSADPVAVVLAKLEEVKTWGEAERQRREAAHQKATGEAVAAMADLGARYPVVADRPAAEVAKVERLSKRSEKTWLELIKTDEATAARARAVFYKGGDAVGPLTIKGPTRGAVAKIAKEGAEFVGNVASRALALATQNVTVIPLPRNTRAKFSPANSSVYLSPTSGADVAVHEIGHWLEAYSAIATRAARDFYARRTAGDKLERLAAIFPGVRYGPEEVARRDKFPQAYAGKWYGNRDGVTGQFATEVVSMALEALYRNPEKFHKDDPDHFAFIVRLLAGDPDAGKKEYKP